MTDRFRIDRAARVILNGGIVACPTEAVYGIGCLPDDPAALEQGRHVGLAVVFLHDLDAAAEFAHGIVEHLAVLLGDRGRNQLGILFEQLLEAEHDAGTLGGRGVPPLGKCGLGGGNRLRDSAGRRHGDLANHLAGCRIGNGERSIVIRPFRAVNKMADDAGRVDTIGWCCVHLDLRIVIPRRQVRAAARRKTVPSRPGRN